MLCIYIYLQGMYKPAFLIGVVNTIRGIYILYIIERVQVPGDFINNI